MSKNYFFKAMIMLSMLTEHHSVLLANPSSCVQIYYDSVPKESETSPHYYYGRIHSIFLQNLLGHFPHLQQYVLPIEKYTSGDLERCKASFYLGTYFNNEIPESFYEDYFQTKKNVLWAGYNIWNMNPEKLAALWPVTYKMQSKLDHQALDPQGRPGFYKYYSYKGEIFEKYGEWNKTDPNQFLAAFEISLFSFDAEEISPYTVSWASHSGGMPKVPYILNNTNHWYVGDSPFSFITVEDRYLIFSDLIFDVLDEPAIHQGKKPALFRIEDIHPRQSLWQLYRLTDMLERKRVPYSIALIPFYSDPYGSSSSGQSEFLPMIGYQPFLDFLQYVGEKGASFIYHGVTHQLGQYRNPYNALTGDDFEFWDIKKNQPIPYDQAEWVISRVQDGHAIIEQSKLNISAWEVPHYQASPLDYRVFAQIFKWNIGRVTYFPHTSSFHKRLSPEQTIESSGSRDNRKRIDTLHNLSVSYPDHLKPSGQFFPYSIFGDIYDQRLLPENLGNFEPFFGIQAPAPRTVDDLIRVALRNRVLRDVWASVFMHPHLLGTHANEGLGHFPGDTSEFERFIDTLRGAGYEFIALGDYIKTHTIEKRPVSQFTFPKNKRIALTHKRSQR